MKRRLRQSLIYAAVVALALGVLATRATADEGNSTKARWSGQQAAAGRADCPSSWFCVWVDVDFVGGPGKWQGNESNYTNWLHGGCGVRSLWTWDNCASSVFNNGQSCNLTFYDGINFAGAWYNLPRGSFLAFMTQDLMSDQANANDRISSHKWCTF
jgi:hypothetical protein